MNKTALPVIHLIDAMKSGVIDYQIVKSGSKLGFEVCMSCQTIIKTHTAAKLFICSKNPFFFLQINFEFSRLNIKLIFMNFHGKKKESKMDFWTKNSFAAVCKT